MSRTSRIKKTIKILSIPKITEAVELVEFPLNQVNNEKTCQTKVYRKVIPIGRNII